MGLILKHRRCEEKHKQFEVTYTAPLFEYGQVREVSTTEKANRFATRVPVAFLIASLLILCERIK